MLELLQIIIVVSNVLIFLLVGYFLQTIKREKKKLDEWRDELAKKEGKIDYDYHQVVDNALSKERKILEDASEEADKIIANTEYVTKSSKDLVDRALQAMVGEIQKEAAVSAGNFISNYKNFLNQLSETSKAGYQNTTREFENDLKGQMEEVRRSLISGLEAEISGLQIQMKKFREESIAGLEKEVLEYKQQRLKDADKTVDNIVKKVIKSVLNKSISQDDHQSLILESLEKARKEGVFD